MNKRDVQAYRRQMRTTRTIGQECADVPTSAHSSPLRTTTINECAVCGHQSGRNSTDSGFCAHCGTVTETVRRRV